MTINNIKKGQIWNDPLTPEMIQFEEETGYKAIYGNKITGRFEHWLFKKGLKISDFSEKKQFTDEHRKKLSEANKEAQNRPELNDKQSKVMIKLWQNEEYQKKMKIILSDAHNRPEAKEHHSKAMIKQWQNEEYQESMTGENHPNYGKIGTENYPNYKKNAKYSANHQWINKHYPQKDICDDKCEICGKFNLHLDLAQFIHINVRNLEDPMLDYFYACPKARKGENCKNSCHTIYDRLTTEQKEELLAGATTREEKLKIIKIYFEKNYDNGFTEFGKSI